MKESSSRGALKLNKSGKCKRISYLYSSDVLFVGQPIYLFRIQMKMQTKKLVLFLCIYPFYDGIVFNLNSMQLFVFTWFFVLFFLFSQSERHKNKDIFY